MYHELRKRGTSRTFCKSDATPFSPEPQCNALRTSRCCRRGCAAVSTRWLIVYPDNPHQRFCPQTPVPLASRIGASICLIYYPEQGGNPHPQFAASGERFQPEG